MTSTSTSPLPLSQDGMKWWRSHLTDQMEGTVLRVIHSPPYATAWIPSSFSFTFLSTPPAFATSASTYWIAIFATELIDVEKAIIRASRSGNRVLVEVGRRQAVFWENSPSPGHREQWVPASESQRSLPAIFKTFTHGPLVLRSEHNVSHWRWTVRASRSFYHWKHCVKNPEDCWLLNLNVGINKRGKNKQR